MIHTSLDFLGEAYIQYKEAVSEYERLREQYFGELRNTVRALIEQSRNSGTSVLMPLGVRQTQSGGTWRGEKIPVESVDFHGIELPGGSITARNTKNIEGYNGNRYVFKNFFGKDVEDGRFTTHSGEKLEIQFEKERTDIIEEARYAGVRHMEGILFQALFASLPNDFKATFLYSASGIQEINCFARSREKPTLNAQGNWHYVDSSFIPAWKETVYEPGILEKLKSFGIINPECISTKDDFCTKSVNDIKAWKFATMGNRSTRIIPGHVGGREWPPKEVEYGSYHIAYAESDQTCDDITASELYKLAKIGGFIILPVWMLKKCPRIQDKVQVLLDYSEGDYALLQKHS